MDWELESCKVLARFWHRDVLKALLGKDWPVFAWQDLYGKDLAKYLQVKEIAGSGVWREQLGEAILLEPPVR